ncbi:hypothetical protein Q427_05120 [Halomonas sp. BC04]|nr:hypothetical protein Q427_05120 [Halomonas sp. BC04]
MSVSLHHLAPDDISFLEGMLVMFGEAFHEVNAYTGNTPK